MAAREAPKTRRVENPGRTGTPANEPKVAEDADAAVAEVVENGVDLPPRN